MGEQGRYLYAVTRGLSPAELAGQTGLSDAALDVLEHRGLSVVVSTVELDEYGEEALRRNLEQMSWLETTARTHDRVVRLAAERGPTAPMRLVTICRDDDGVRRRLDDSYDRLVQALDRVEGRVEWSVKAYAAPRAEAVREPVDATGAGGGAAYLRARKEALRSRQTQEEAALEVAAEIHEALSQLAVAARRLAPQDPRLTGHEGRMTLNAAYLVDEADMRFAAEVDRLAGEHPEAQLGVDGPWPPYSFATLEDV